MTESRDPIDDGFERLKRRGEPSQDGVTPPAFVERIVDGSQDASELPAAARAMLFDAEARDRALELLAADLALEREAGGATGNLVPAPVREHRDAGRSAAEAGPRVVPGEATHGGRVPGVSGVPGSAMLQPGLGSPIPPDRAGSRDDPAGSRSIVASADRGSAPTAPAAGPSSLRRAWPWLAGVAAAALVAVVVRTWFFAPAGDPERLDLGGYVVAVVGDPTPPKAAGSASPLRPTLRMRASERLSLVARGGGAVPKAASGLVAAGLRLDRAEEVVRSPLVVDGTVAIFGLAPGGPGVYLLAIGTREPAALEKALRSAAVGPQEALARGEGLASAHGALEAALAPERGATDALYVLVEVVP